METLHTWKTQKADTDEYGHQPRVACARLEQDGWEIVTVTPQFDDRGDAACWWIVARKPVEGRLVDTSRCV